MSEEKPNLRPYKRHILVCTGPNCAPHTSGPLYQKLKERLKELGLHEGAHRIQRSQCRCFGVCKGGPLAVVYPEDVWYHGVTEESLEQIIQDHLKDGKPVKDHVFYHDKRK